MQKVEYDNPSRCGSPYPIPQVAIDAVVKEIGEHKPFDIHKRYQIIEVEIPFILADNYFDNGEANNFVVEINAQPVKHVFFTGGSCYTIYVIKDPSQEAYTVQGNNEEGYNIFRLKG